MKKTIEPAVFLAVAAALTFGGCRKEENLDLTDTSYDLVSTYSLGLIGGASNHTSCSSYKEQGVTKFTEDVVQVELAVSLDRPTDRPTIFRLSAEGPAEALAQQILPETVTIPMGEKYGYFTYGLNTTYFIDQPDNVYTDIVIKADAVEESDLVLPDDERTEQDIHIQKRPYAAEVNVSCVDGNNYPFFASWQGWTPPTLMEREITITLSQPALFDAEIEIFVTKAQCYQNRQTYEPSIFTHSSPVTFTIHKGETETSEHKTLVIDPQDLQAQCNPAGNGWNLSIGATEHTTTQYEWISNPAYSGVQFGVYY